MASLCQGRIVHADMLDPQGRNPKLRPAVVLTPTGEINQEGEVLLVAITGRLDAAPRDSQVELPWQAQGHTPTKLTKPSAVVCSWFMSVPVRNIQPEHLGGMVPGAKLRQIIQKVNEMLASRSSPAKPTDDSAPEGNPPAEP